MKENKMLIYVLLIIIFFCSIILAIKIINTPKYDQKLYQEIYMEYDTILSTIEQDNNKEDNTIVTNNKTYITKDSSGNEYRVIGRIVIPKINISYPIINQSTEEYLNIAPTKYFGADINEIGNCCIAGHNNRNGEFFGKLNQLKIGDKVILTSNTGKTLDYEIYKIYEVSETDMSCTDQETNGNIEATLITCTSNSRRRLIVKCRAA